MSRRNQGDAASQIKRHNCSPAPALPLALRINGRCGSGAAVVAAGGVGNTVNVGNLRPPGLPMRRLRSTGLGGRPTAICVHGITNGETNSKTAPQPNRLQQTSSFRWCVFHDGTGGRFANGCKETWRAGGRGLRRRLQSCCCWRGVVLRRVVCNFGVARAGVRCGALWCGGGVVGVVWWFACVCGLVVRCGAGLLPRLLLQVLCAASSGLAGSPGMTWSAVHGSLARAPCPHSQQTVAVARTCLARLR